MMADEFIPSPGAFGTRGGEPVRLFGSQLLPRAGDEAPGSVLGLEGERLLIAANGGRLAVAKLRVGDGKKVPAAEAGLDAGARLD